MAVRDIISATYRYDIPIDMIDLIREEYFDSYMDRPTVSRRSFGISIATVSALSLAGCMDGGPAGDNDSDGGDDGGDNDSDGDNESDFDYANREEYTLTIIFENEDGEPVSQGIEGELAPVDFTAAEYNFTGDGVVEGVLEVDRQEGTWALTVESTEDEFEPVEEEIQLDSDTEITVTLDGATPDSERETDEEGE